MYWFAPENAQMDEMGIWRRSTDGEVFSFWFVTEQRPGAAKGVRTHRCKHREEEWYRHVAGIVGRECVSVGFRHTKDPSQGGMDTSAQVPDVLPWGHSWVLWDGWRLSDVSRWKTAVSVSALDVLSQTFLSEFCMGLDQVSVLVLLLLLKSAFLRVPPKCRYHNFAFVGSRYWKFSTKFWAQGLPW